MNLNNVFEFCCNKTTFNMHLLLKLQYKCKERGIMLTGSVNAIPLCRSYSMSTLVPCSKFNANINLQHTYSRKICLLADLLPNFPYGL